MFGPAGMTPRTWAVALPAGLRMLNQNDRRHWAEKGRITRDLRKAAWACARNLGIPALEMAAVVVEYQPPLNGRRRDADNIAAAGKPAIDGLVDARVLPSDDSRHLTEVIYRVGAAHPRGRLVLYVTETVAEAGS
jgi:crossover junction endodeoxyribonuclease RusA